MKARHGCLTLLALFTLWIAVASWFTSPADNGVAIMLGVCLALAVIYAYSGINWLIDKCDRDTRGFPVIMKRPEDKQ